MRTADQDLAGTKPVFRKTAAALNAWSRNLLTNVWLKNLWDFQAKSGTESSCRFWPSVSSNSVAFRPQKKKRTFLSININKCAGLSRDWVGGKILFMLFFRVIPYGGWRHRNKIPPKPGTIPSTFCLCVFFVALRFVRPRCTRETDGIAVKLLRCGIASEALRRNMPQSQAKLQIGKSGNMPGSARHPSTIHRWPAYSKNANFHLWKCKP